MPLIVIDRRSQQCGGCPELRVSRSDGYCLGKQLKGIILALGSQGGARPSGQQCGLGGKVLRRRLGKQTNCFLIPKPPGVEAKHVPKCLQCLLRPTTSEVGHAQLIEGIFEVRSQCDGLLEVIGPLRRAWDRGL